MAKNSIRDYSATNSSNTDIQSIDISEGCSPAGINNAIREVMADLKDVSTGAVALESPAADSLSVTGDLTVDTNTLYVDSTNNRVGIGTSSPSSNLHVKTTGSGDALVVESSDSGDTFAPDIAIYRNTSTPADNDGIGLVSFRGRNDASQDVEYVQIVTGAGDVTDGSENGNFGIKTMVDGSLDNRFVIDNSGNVGIGTSSPPVGLSVQGSTGDKATVQIKQTAAGGRDYRLTSRDDGSFRIADDTAGSERMRIDSNGDVKIGSHYEFRSNGDFVIPASGFSGGTDSKQMAAAILYSSRSTTSTAAHLSFYNANGEVGSVTTSGSSTSYNTSSDYRLKENVVADWDATTRLKQLNPVRFNFIADPDTTVDGFLAHEVQDIVPEAISGIKDAVDDEGNPVYQGIDQSKLVPLLVKTIQELEARITALEAN